MLTTPDRATTDQTAPDQGTTDRTTSYHYKSTADGWRPSRGVLLALRKLASTARIVATLAMARTFGTYEITVFDGELTYAKYRWRGQTWAIPTGPMEEHVA